MLAALEVPSLSLLKQQPVQLQQQRNSGPQEEQQEHPEDQQTRHVVHLHRIELDPNKVTTFHEPEDLQGRTAGTDRLAKQLTDQYYSDCTQEETTLKQVRGGDLKSDNKIQAHDVEHLNEENGENESNINSRKINKPQSSGDADIKVHKEKTKIQKEKEFNYPRYKFIRSKPASNKEKDNSQEHPKEEEEITAPSNQDKSSTAKMYKNVGSTVKCERKRRAHPHSVSGSLSVSMPSFNSSQSFLSNLTNHSSNASTQATFPQEVGREEQELVKKEETKWTTDQRANVVKTHPADAFDEEDNHLQQQMSDRYRRENLQLQVKNNASDREYEVCRNAAECSRFLQRKYHRFKKIQ